MFNKLIKFLFCIRQRNTANQSLNGNLNQTPSSVPPFMNGFMNMPQPFLPAMSIAQSNTPATQNQPHYTPEQYALAQQISMQNMMHQMYIQYMNQYAMYAQQQLNNTSGSNTMPAFIPPNFMTQSNATDNLNAPNVDQLPQQQQQQQPQPQEVVNEAARQIQADDDAENRDWLEILYTLSRLLVLLSLVYFYSSPGRCSIVIIVIVLYYL